ncbi:phenylalanine--tRNA ligase subunit beta [Ruminococcaceae bacterium OttesenSCG-928-I18]|nr:phenylalanine--tRNA ligase subunit beta [Ruminococcaceae bacterium OttesenSCG-928-I18]
MKLPLRWAQSFADFTATPKEFADRMTMSGSKVETYESEAESMKKEVIGRVTELARHPDSDHLWICQVDIGQEVIQIVTGAQNLKEGDLCPVALHGAKLPSGAEIKRGKLRGVVSNGMLCSLDELNLSLNDFPGAVEDGILVLEEDAPLGQDAAVALGMDDTVFEFEITPNRPDCLSVLGLAREAAATFGVPFTASEPPEPTGDGDVSEYLSVKVEASDLCMRYSAAMVENVRIQPSPRWMRERLRLSGVRPINNIVDITNYVMLEYGQPMHAFDYAYVNGKKITVRRAAEGEQIVTLDGAERALTPNMMVIADEKGPIAVAGVMGGEYSGVYETTSRVVFESACFHGPSVRATSKKLGLRTESSSRFEKGLDPANAGGALRRALELVRELDAGDIVGGMLDDYPSPSKPRGIPFDPAAINRLLGIDVSEQDMVDTLLPLGFSVENGVVTVPTFRADVERSCDIAEEVARFAGYNNIPLTILRGEAKAIPSRRQRFEKRLVETLAGYGFWECETFSFYSPKSFDRIHLAAQNPLRKAVAIQNPLGEDTSLMRTTALPSMMEVVGRNWASRNEEAALFELATEYTPTEDPEQLPEEHKKMVLAAYGKSWDYLAIKGTVEALFEVLGVDTSELLVKRNEQGESYHPGRCADLSISLRGENGRMEEKKLATLGEIHPLVNEAYEIRHRVVAAEISVEALFEAQGDVPQYKPLPKFPAVTRDLSLVAAEDVPAADIERTLRKAGGKRLESLALFDVYKGENIGKGNKSLAYSLVLRDAGATLTDADADALIEKILAQLKQMGVVLRS